MLRVYITVYFSTTNFFNLISWYITAKIARKSSSGNWLLQNRMINLKQIFSQRNSVLFLILIQSLFLETAQRSLILIHGKKFYNLYLNEISSLPKFNIAWKSLNFTFFFKIILFRFMFQTQWIHSILCVFSTKDDKPLHIILLSFTISFSLF